MDPNTILTLITGIIGLVTVLVGRRANAYFQAGNRTERARLVQILAKDILALVQLQKGVSAENAEIIRVSIDRLYAALVGVGFNAESARDIAKSGIAGAAAEAGFPLSAINL